MKICHICVFKKMLHSIFNKMFTSVLDQYKILNIYIVYGNVAILYPVIYLVYLTNMLN